MKKYLMTLVGLSLLTSLLMAADSNMEKGQKLTQSFYKGEVKEMWGKFTPELKALFKGKVEELQKFQKSIQAQLGTEKKSTGETISKAPPWTVYSRTAEFSKSPKPVLVQWTFDDEGNIGGMLVKVN